MSDPRPWIKVSVDLPRHPKTQMLSDRAFRDLVTLWCFAGEFKNSGVFSEKILKKIVKNRQKNELIDAGFLTVSDGAEPVYTLHDWEVHQTSPEHIKKKKRMSNGGSLAMHKRWHEDRGIISEHCTHCQKAISTL